LKVAVTADLHLTTRKKNPERFHALEDILKTCYAEKIRHLIVAGDLFDAESRHYSDFDALVRDSQSHEMQWYIIPGNHDQGFRSSHLTADNISVFSDPFLPPRLDLMSRPVLFIPYLGDVNMGEAVASFADDLPPNQWILVGHGDWISGIREPNPLEPGVYMPLTRTDLSACKPQQAILGHIHKAIDEGDIHYPGSPCPLDITETGKRRFLVLDSETGAVESRKVNSDIIYFNETLFIYPVPDETEYITEQIRKRISQWHLSERETGRTRIRVRLQGYSTDIKKLDTTVRACFSGFAFYDSGGPDLSQVGLSSDFEREDIARKTVEWIKKLSWKAGIHEPGKEQILIEALRAIYEA